MHVFKQLLKENEKKSSFCTFEYFMWNYYAYGLTSCDCVEVWWQRKMELAFADGKECV